MLNCRLTHSTRETMRALLCLALAALLASSIVPVLDAAGIWTNGRAADVVLGQPNFTSSSPALSSSGGNSPRQVAVDPATRKVFLTDNGNNRILRFSSAAAAVSGSAAEAVLGQADFTHGAANRGGSAAANTLSGVTGAFVDGAGRLWVADRDNHRVLRFDSAASKTDGADADGVLGQADFTHNFPNRGAVTAANTMSTPMGVWIDAYGRLWVADVNNNRVLRFDNAAAKTDGADADGVLGQALFSSNAPATAQNRMSAPFHIIGSHGNMLFVADSGNHRVLRFVDAATKANGPNADAVLGQADFTSNANPDPPNQASLNSPMGVAYEDYGGRLFVSDGNNRRVLIFANATIRSNGASADYVLGQTDFVTNTPNTGGISASTLSTTRMVFFDNALNALWVADTANNRVLRYTPVPTPTTTGVTSSANPSAVGRPVSFTATVSVSSGPPALGGIQFQVDGSNLGLPVALSAGIATSIATSSLSVGTHAVTAAFSSNSGFGASQGNLIGGQVVAHLLYLPLIYK